MCVQLYITYNTDYGDTDKDNNGDYNDIPICIYIYIYIYKLYDIFKGVFLHMPQTFHPSLPSNQPNWSPTILIPPCHMQQFQWI